LLRHAFAEQQATLEDASKFSTHHRQEEVGFYILSRPFFTFPTSLGALGRQGKVGITFITSLLSFPLRGGRFFALFHQLQHSSAKKGRVLNTFFASFQPSPARKVRFLHLFHRIYSILSPREVRFSYFSPHLALCGMEISELKFLTSLFCARRQAESVFTFFIPYK
jgi:hypothetical protein